MDFRALTEKYAEVATIPANIASLPVPSKAIERLLTKREAQHNSTLNSVRLNCQKYNLEIDEDFQIEAEKLKENLAKIREEIERESFIVLKKQHEDELANLSLEIFQQVHDSVEHSHNRRLEHIDEFYNNVRNLEKKRSNYFKCVLQDAYKKTNKVSHLLPYELLDYFEHEIVHLNEITMNNYHYYAKVHTDLKLLVQEEIRVITLKMLEVQEKYKMAAKIAKLREVVDAQAHKRDDFIVQAKLSVWAIGDIQDPSFTTDDLPLMSVDVEKWSKHIKKTLDNLDANSKKLIEMYKMAVVNIFNRFFQELKSVTDIILDDDKKSRSSLDLDYINAELYKPIVDDIAQQYTCDITELQELWDSITKYMESDIKNTYMFLAGSAHLWDAHYDRVTDAKNIILKDLKLLINKHDKAAQNSDKKVYAILDKMRDESTVPKLNKHLQDANKFLDSVAKLFANQCNAEIKLLQKYQTLIDKGIDLLISEIDRFLGETAHNPNIQDQKSWEKISKRESPEEDPKDKWIPHQMRACQFQVEAVNNWMFGLWEAIRLYMTTCRKELSEKAALLMENYITKLQKRLEVRMATHKPRYQRIKTMIYDVRLKELEDHLDQLHDVEERVQQYLRESQNLCQMSKENSVLVLEEFGERMKQIEKKLSSATKSYHVAACIEQVKTIAGEVLPKSQHSFEENYETIEQTRQKINKFICHFSSSIKLFVEGGNFGRDEAKLFKKKLQKINKGVPKKCQKILGDYNAAKADLLQTSKHSEAAILARLDLAKKEFEHNESTCAKIKILQGKIRSFAYETKFKIHRVDACIDYLADMSQITIWERKHFDIMKDAVQECFEKIEELTHFLIGDRAGRCYIVDLNQLIDDSFQEIEVTAKGFYATHGPIINKGKIQECFEDFINEVEKSYKGFRVQVEIHCLECVYELIRHIQKLLKVNDEVYNVLVQKFPNLKTTESDDKEEELSVKLSRESMDLEERKQFLEESRSQEKVFKSKSEDSKMAVTDIILKNNDRVKFLYCIIMKLMNCLKHKMALMEGCVLNYKDVEEEEDCLQNSENNDNKQI